MITKEKIADFNPFEKPCFKCPVCGSTAFVELEPYGGVWCRECNASFEVRGTCDGLRKIAVSCITDHCWKIDHRERADLYGTVIWEEDEEISWFAVKDNHVIRPLILK